jgi:MEDS: MEthanogen/methylotroph, DcmR Sensory domain
MGRYDATMNVVLRQKVVVPSPDGETMIETDYRSGGRHVVQFYGHDEELADGVADYLLGALNRGDAAIVIATAAHRRDFETRLEQAGVDLAAARASGTYLAMDAAATVREFMAADRLDHAAFNRVVGQLIRQAGTGGRAVRVYSEMVALLWDHGLVNAAAQLEVMWDELARRDAFSLFCGYRADSVSRDAHLDAFAEVCRLHRQVVGGPSSAAIAGGVLGAVRTFALSRDAPAAARHFAVAATSHWGAENLADDVAIVVTELAANAVRHARSGFTVILSSRRNVLRIAVRDASPVPAGGSGPELAPTPLHGLGAVEAMASRWGVEPLGSSGKTVWVELSR